MFPIQHLDALHWHSYLRVPAFLLASEWRTWLLDRGSLTQRLIQVSRDSFRVQVLLHKKALPLHHERLPLGLKSRQFCLIREVALLCDGQPMVFARSVIPLTSLVGPERQLARLNEKPLGALLFQHPNMQRGELQIAPFFGLAGDRRIDGWGRRSVFYLNQRPLLVCEFFLPDLLSKTA